MQRQGTYFPVLNKEDRAIALSAYTFPGRAEWLGWGVRTAGKLCMQEKKPKSHLWILKLTTFNVSLELMWFFCESQSNQGSWSSKKAVKIQKSLFSPLSLMKQVQIDQGNLQLPTYNKNNSPHLLVNHYAEPSPALGAFTFNMSSLRYVLSLSWNSRNLDGFCFRFNLTLIQHSPCTRHCPKIFTDNNSLNPHSHPIK